MATRIQLPSEDPRAVVAIATFLHKSLNTFDGLTTMQNAHLSVIVALHFIILLLCAVGFGIRVAKRGLHLFTVKNKYWCPDFGLGTQLSCFTYCVLWITSAFFLMKEGPTSIKTFTLQLVCYFPLGVLFHIQVWSIVMTIPSMPFQFHRQNHRYLPFGPKIANLLFSIPLCLNVLSIFILYGLVVNSSSNLNKTLIASRVVTPTSPQDLVEYYSDQILKVINRVNITSMVYVISLGIWVCLYESVYIYATYLFLRAITLQREQLLFALENFNALDQPIEYSPDAVLPAHDIEMNLRDSKYSQNNQAQKVELEEKLGALQRLRQSVVFQIVPLVSILTAAIMVFGFVVHNDYDIPVLTSTYALGWAGVLCLTATMSALLHTTLTMPSTTDFSLSASFTIPKKLATMVPASSLNIAKAFSGRNSEQEGSNKSKSKSKSKSKNSKTSSGKSGFGLFGLSSSKIQDQPGPEGSNGSASVRIVTLPLGSEATPYSPRVSTSKEK